MKKVIVVTGANGQLGRAISKRLSKIKNVIIKRTDIIDSSDIDVLDITNIDEIDIYMSSLNPYAIINCAAFTNVDGCEKAFDDAYKLNAIGPKNLSIIAEKYNSKIVQISTDYVFTGNSKKPYNELDEALPISAYGKTKLAGEEFVKQFSTKWFIIRTAWLYGDGKNFVQTMIKLSETNNEISVVDDQIGSPTSTEALTDIIEKLLWTDNYGLYHGTCEGICSWAEFTEEIFKIKNISTKVNHISTEEYEASHPNSAKRPRYSVLDNYMLRLVDNYTVKHWKQAIQDYLQ